MEPEDFVVRELSVAVRETVLSEAASEAELPEELDVSEVDAEASADVSVSEAVFWQSMTPSSPAPVRSHFLSEAVPSPLRTRMREAVAEPVTLVRVTSPSA